MENYFEKKDWKGQIITHPSKMVHTTKIYENMSKIYASMQFADFVYDYIMKNKLDEDIIQSTLVEFKRK